MNNVMVLARLADTAITDPVGDWDNGYNEGVEKALEVAVECFSETDGDDQFKRIADALERANPPHGWEIIDVAFDSDTINMMAVDRWSLFTVVPDRLGVVAVLRRPASAPTPEEPPDFDGIDDYGDGSPLFPETERGRFVLTPSEDQQGADSEECPACANGNTELGPKHSVTCPKHIPF